ncbi:MAG: Vitamin B12 import ATP-binding protein BtuD [Desulfovibrio sp.]
MRSSISDFRELFRNIYKRLPQRLRRGVWFTTSISLLVALLELALALAVSLLGVSLAAPESLMQQEQVQAFLRYFPEVAPLLTNQRNLLVFLLSSIVIALLLKCAVSMYMYWKQGWLSQEISAYINHSLFKGYLYGSYLWHVGQETALLQTHLSWREQVATFVMQLLLFSTYFSVTFFLLLSMLITAPVVGLFVLIVTGICGVSIFRWTRKRVHRLSRETSKIQVELNAVTLPAIQGIREVLIYRQQKEFLALSDALNRKLCHLRPQSDMMPPLPPLLLEIVGMIMLLGSVLFMNWQGVSLAHMTATITLMAAVAWRLLPTMNRFISALVNAQAALPYVQPVLKRIDEVQTFSGAAGIEAAPCPLTRDIQFKHVSFRYPQTQDTKSDALRNICLTIPKGAKVGFIGTSGSGKSTLIGILTGLFAPTCGELLVDGQIMTAERRAGWMEGIGYVPQSTFLLNATIAQNVAFSNWGQPIDISRVQKCCRMAAMDFVLDLPEGVNTVIGERGIRLSGGQVQRISVARALYKNPHTLIFDEATSALDGAAEKEIMQMIQGLNATITVIIVAHRLTTVEDCDYVYWLKDGQQHQCGKASDIIDQYKTFLQNKTSSTDH